MIYKFKSQACGEVIMLSLDGEKMLLIVGKPPEAKGIITVAQIPAAIAALEAAISADEAAPAKPGPASKPSTEDDKPPKEDVMLRHRAGPFIALLTCSAEAGKDVVWGV